MRGRYVVRRSTSGYVSIPVGPSWWETVAFLNLEGEIGGKG